MSHHALAVFAVIAIPAIVAAEDLTLKARYQAQIPLKTLAFETREKLLSWKPEKTAIIICDVWDYHHCLNAVRRLEEFAPRMNDLVKNARAQGVTIIHSPSDCMPAYENHPARQRAMSGPKVKLPDPEQIKTWCSYIPSERIGTYPIDQSDGGEDDDPAEHAEWAAKLKALGRNPNMPWKAQSALIEIDGGKDYISDRGDEVWSILATHGIDNVVLVGVHVNMCVLGRPFGLRQMVRNGKNVILVRDMTDAMYNPARWPYVDHFTGTDFVIDHIEKYVCPTVTSDQFLGGKPFRSKYDTRTGPAKQPNPYWDAALVTKTWRPVSLSSTWDSLNVKSPEVAWFRANVRINESFVDEPIKLTVASPKATAWLNGQPLKRELAGDSATFAIPKSTVNLDDANLLVIRLADGQFLPPPTIAGKSRFAMQGRWEARVGDEPAWANIPLPAKFGMSPDSYFEPK